MKTGGVPKPKRIVGPYDARKIVNAGDAFLIAAERALEKRWMGPRTFQAAVMPGVVCLAFASELFFKAILTIESHAENDHDLFLLFGALKPSSQSFIRERLSISEADLDEKLAAVAHAFEQWRYIYEYQATAANPGAPGYKEPEVSPAFLRGLADAARAATEVLLNAPSPTEPK
jgi:hypothetical protein